MKISIAALVAVLFALAAGPAPAQQSLSETVERLAQEVADLKRRVGAVSAADEYGDVIAVRNTAGQTVLSLEADADGGILRVRNGAG